MCSLFYYLLCLRLYRKQKKQLSLLLSFGGRELCNCWAQGSEDNYVLSTKAGKHFKRCNKYLYKFPKNQKLTVHIFDISNSSWSMDSFDVVTCLETKQECPYIEKIYVVV